MTSSSQRFARCCSPSQQCHRPCIHDEQLQASFHLIATNYVDLCTVTTARCESCIHSMSSSLSQIACANIKSSALKKRPQILYNRSDHKREQMNISWSKSHSLFLQCIIIKVTFEKIASTQLRQKDLPSLPQEWWTYLVRYGKQCTLSLYSTTLNSVCSLSGESLCTMGSFQHPWILGLQISYTTLVVFDTTKTPAQNLCFCWYRGYPKALWWVAFAWSGCIHLWKRVAIWNVVPSFFPGS